MKKAVLREYLKNREAKVETKPIEVEETKPKKKTKKGDK